MMKVFTESGKELPPKAPFIKKVFSLGWPVEYNLDEGFLKRLQEGKEELFCIDMGGRNHGVQESVYVKVSDVIEFLEAEGILK